VPELNGSPRHPCGPAPPASACTPKRSHATLRSTTLALLGSCDRNILRHTGGARTKSRIPKCTVLAGWRQVETAVRNGVS
jgi:hypothetical protein